MRTIRKKFFPTFSEKERIDAKLHMYWLAKEEQKRLENHKNAYDMCAFFPEGDRYVEISVISSTKKRNTEVIAVLKDLDGKEVSRNTSGHWQDEWRFQEDETEYILEIASIYDIFHPCMQNNSSEDKYYYAATKDVEEVILLDSNNAREIKIELQKVGDQELNLRAVKQTEDGLFDIMDEKMILDILNCYYDENFTSFFKRSDMPDTLFFVSSPKVQHYLLKLKSHDDIVIEKNIVVQADHMPTRSEAWGFFKEDIWDRFPMFQYVSSVKRISYQEFTRRSKGEKWEGRILVTEELPADFH